LPAKRSVKKKKEKSFEEALSKLEEIVLELEEGDLSLEKALEKFNKGIELSRFCAHRLSQAEEKVKKLIKIAEGEFGTEPLDLEEEE
jgi:exodeoxyribonuclease VII small subunit